MSHIVSELLRRAISTIYILIGALIVPICAMDVYSSATAPEFVAVALAYIICALCVLPVPIVSFVMMNKLGKYRAKLYTDCNDGISHCSVGSIVLAALFQPVMELDFMADKVAKILL